MGDGRSLGFNNALRPKHEKLGFRSHTSDRSTRARYATSAATSASGTATSSAVQPMSVGYRSITQTSTRSPDYVWRAARSRRDLATAVNIADRYDPWGESLPLKSAGDDIPRDGSACDSTTTHRESGENSSQMTLTAYEESKPSASDERRATTNWYSHRVGSLAVLRRGGCHVVVHSRTLGHVTDCRHLQSAQ